MRLQEEFAEEFCYLLCGWSDEIHNMLKILDMQNGPGTEVCLVCGDLGWVGGWVGVWHGRGG